MILGHRPPKVTAAVVKAIQERGTVFALPTTDEITLARRIIDLVPSIEQVRLCNTGTEAVLYALRLARTFTGRKKVIRFEGMYHGFSDGVYWSKHPRLSEAGPPSQPVPVPQGPGMPSALGEQLIILPWNDLPALREAIAREGANIAAVLTEPVMCNTGCILPEKGYLEGMRELTAANGIVLIFDEVITGFRLNVARRPGALRPASRSVGLRQRAGWRVPCGRAGRPQGHHGAGRGWYGIDGRHLCCQHHRRCGCPRRSR